MMKVIMTMVMVALMKITTMRNNDCDVERDGGVGGDMGDDNDDDDDDDDDEDDRDDADENADYGLKIMMSAMVMMLPIWVMANKI